ncbi:MULTISPECIES: hypothetical protein [Halomonadaceae]|mgnify:CR=1 FL=1|uniref:hypothetical protein n=1 Tax=Halomonadaceae TaxID=28256 RepID=UPI00022D2A08|nr:hypothetical protein [Halomonas sp. HAL1]EHA14310.1 hypothetical protein HAL1_18016 [Halomonas sp. HAL1]WKV92430.1 hypothetical protein Q3Y66_16500 [Halomonas sp. HAL1]
MPPELTPSELTRPELAERLAPLPYRLSTAANVQRSLRQCLSIAAEVLYDHGHVLETITLSQRGLTRRELLTLGSVAPTWATCQQVMEDSGAATFNDYDRFVLTRLGRELMFDMFGQGAADCA